MHRLSENWLSDGWMDFEYKKYVLLAYLQHVSKQYREIKLYPPLGELIQHYDRLKKFSDDQHILRVSFPKDVEGIDAQKLEIRYRDRERPEEWMKELESIIAYSLPKIKNSIEEGKSLYNVIEKGLEVEPVGITPLYQREGYAMLTFEHTKEVMVYRYTVNLFQHSGDLLRGIALRFIERIRYSLIHTLQQIKLDLAKRFADLPNPSVWRIHSENQLPLEESILPISKRLLLKKIAV